LGDEKKSRRKKRTAVTIIWGLRATKTKSEAVLRGEWEKRWSPGCRSTSTTIKEETWGIYLTRSGFWGGTPIKKPAPEEAWLEVFNGGRKEGRRQKRA